MFDGELLFSRMSDGKSAYQKYCKGKIRKSEVHYKRKI